MQKFKEIQNRLNNLSIQDPVDASGPNKVKIRQLQTMIGRLTSSLQQDDVTRQYKLNEMLDKLKKIESTFKDTSQESSIKQAAFDATLNRVQKNLKKKLQKLSKLKKQSDKQFQSSLSTYLIELSGFKGKMSNTCLNHISHLKQKQQQIQTLQKYHLEQSSVTKEILKKIYQQYMNQVEELNSLILEEQTQKKLQEQLLQQRLTRIYQQKVKELGDMRFQRQKQEAQMILLLQKVVDRVRAQVVKM